MTQSLPHSVGTEVRAEMARQGVTQREIAAAVGLPQPSISKRLAGAIPFDLAELEAVAEALGVPVAKFLPPPAAA